MTQSTIDAAYDLEATGPLLTAICRRHPCHQAHTEADTSLLRNWMHDHNTWHINVERPLSREWCTRRREAYNAAAAALVNQLRAYEHDHPDDAVCLAALLQAVDDLPAPTSQEPS